MTAAHPVVLVAHGTRSPIGRARVRELVDGVRILAPHRRVLLAHVDVEEPRVGDLLAHEGESADVVPLFLSAGVHVRQDVLDAARDVHGARVLEHLGMRPVITDLLVEAAQTLPGSGPVVLASAGASNDRARAEVQALGERLAERLGREVMVGFVGGPGPSVEAAIATASAAEGIVTHLLAPGLFADLVAKHAGAHGIPVTAPLLDTDHGRAAVARDIVAHVAAAV